MAYKIIGVCGSCQRTVFGPMRARTLGHIKSCKHCRGTRSAPVDEAQASEDKYFERMSAEYQMEVQGYVSSI
jgi:hypothetical protein